MIAPYIRLAVTGVPELLGRVDGLKEAYMARVRSGLQLWATQTVAQMQENHPPGGPHPPPGVQPVYGEHAYIDRTGRLTRSIGYTIEQWSGRSLTLTVFATMPYAELVEYGTPRSRPYPFFWPVVWARVPLLEEMLADTVMDVIQEFSEGSR